MKIPFFLLLFFTLQSSLLSQLKLSIESGIVSTQYNDVRVPNGDINSGTLFSLSDDFEQDSPIPFIRAELSYLIADKHTIELTAVPLTINYSNANREPFNFEGITFSGSDIDGRYEFNTYRASYRYRVISKDRFSLNIGASILVRDARIAISQGATEVDNTDLGIVPLVSFELLYKPSNTIWLTLKGDALVGPVGRAEDIFAGALYQMSNSLSLKAGYRVIEGGADVDQVYNFAFFHFADIGLVYSL